MKNPLIVSSSELDLQFPRRFFLVNSPFFQWFFPLPFLTVGRARPWSRVSWRRWVRRTCGRRASAAWAASTMPGRRSARAAAAAPGAGRAWKARNTDAGFSRGRWVGIPSPMDTLWLCQHSYWKWPIYSEFSHETLWFSIAMLVYRFNIA